MTVKKQVEILLVEDSPTDARLTIEALKQGKARNTVHHVEDGEQALAFLHREGDYKQAIMPDVILLDLNLPRKSGLEVLREIRAEERLRRVPVVVLTTSSDEQDVLAAYGLNANCYLIKPVNMEEFVEAMKTRIQNDGSKCCKKLFVNVEYDPKLKASANAARIANMIE